jgi:hypothetical protein
MPSHHETFTSIMVQLVNSLSKDVCNFVDLFLSSLPVADVDCITDAGKECLIVA